MTNSTTAATTPTSGQSTSPIKRYTAVVYFHGMGNQRRYEEVSSLLNQLDNLIYQQRGAARPRSLNLRPIAMEQSRFETSIEGKPIAYYEVSNPQAAFGSNDPDRSPTVRFYEAYWANHTAGGTNAFSTINWVVRQWRRPMAVLWAAWGEVGSLRVGTLYEMYEQQQGRYRAKQQELPAQDVRVVKYLIQAYRLFVEADSRYNDIYNNSYRGSSFKEFGTFLSDDIDQLSSQDRRYNAFSAFIQDDFGSQPTSDFDKETFKSDVLQMARRWRRHDTVVQVRALALMVSLLIILGMIVLLAVGLVYVIVQFLIRLDSATLAYIIRSTPSFLLTTVSRIAIALFFLVLGVTFYNTIKSFFSEYMGDVHNYLTYQETDAKYARREAILRDSKALLMHVLLDDACERVVVVAHSLGSVIAYDTLLELRRIEWGRRPAGTSLDQSLDLADVKPEGKRREENVLRLDKIKHFVTMGSPIDKVVYFFAALQSKVPRFVETISALRGDISQPPFTWTEKIGLRDQVRPHIHWVNYWDQADLVSGPIHNIVGTRFQSERVDNVRVASLRVPLPNYSHGGYFDHRYVLQDIFDITFTNKYSFVTAENTLRPEGQQWFADKLVYRKESRRFHRFQKLCQMGAITGVLVLLVVLLWLVLPLAVMLLGVLLGLFALVVAVVFAIRQRKDPAGSGTLLGRRFSVDPHGPLFPPDETSSPRRPEPVEETLTAEKSLELLLEAPVPPVQSHSEPSA